MLFDHNVGESVHLSELRTVEWGQKFVWAVTLGNKFLSQTHCGMSCNVTEEEKKIINITIIYIILIIILFM